MPRCISIGGASNATTVLGNLSTNGSLTSGDAAGDVFDHNGDLAKFGGAGDGYAYLKNERLNFGYASNATFTGYVNWEGYNEGTTQFRNLIVGDGKQATVATFTGSDKSLAVVGNLSTNGNTQLGDASTDRVGIGIAPDANHAMTFTAATGPKIALFPVSGTAAVGFGVASDTLQYFVDNVNARHSFGYGDSDAFTESQRFDADGQVFFGDTVAGTAVENNVNNVVRVGN